MSTPIDLAACVRKLSASENRIYEWRFLRALRERIRRREGAAASAKLRGVRSVYQFDDTYVVTVNTGSTDGFIGLNLVNPAGVVDVVGNQVNVPYVGPVYTVVKEAPTALNIVPLGISPTNSALVLYKVTFSEAYGKHVLKVTAYDNAGNAKSRSITVRNKA